MFTLIDLYTIRKDTGEVFTHNSPMFKEYVAFCNAGGVPIVNDSTMFSLVEGIYIGSKYFRLKIKPSSITKRKSYLVQNLYAQKGRVIEVLCSAVINYMTGKNDEEGIDVDGMLAAHGNILNLLSVNRHTSAKVLIDAVIPDTFITMDDIEYIASVYAAHTAELTAIKNSIAKAKA